VKIRKEGKFIHTLGVDKTSSVEETQDRTEVVVNNPYADESYQKDATTTTTFTTVSSTTTLSEATARRIT